MVSVKGILYPQFILIMDVLNSLFIKAGDEGLLQPVANRSANHMLTMWLVSYAHLSRRSQEILDCFSNVSGLQTNLPKS